MRAWTETLEQRINDLTDLRDKLFNCIGCGCLSVTDGPLRNCDDKLGAQGPGPRILITAAERRARPKRRG